MSFSQNVKNELARIEDSRLCCRMAELTAMIRMAGSLSIGGSSMLGINISTENAAVARKLFNLLKRNFDVHAKIMVCRNQRLKKQNTYLLQAVPSPEAVATLKKLGIVTDKTFATKSDRPLLRRQCCRKAYLRGAFLGGGSVSRPEGEYHLELVTGSGPFAKSLGRLLEAFTLSPGLARRKQDYMVYLKGGEEIISFLSIVGAHQAMMEFENVRVVKDMRNRVNRLVNCETANLSKTADAAARMADKIHLIEVKLGFARLNPGLRNIAEVRLQYPEASLREMVDLLGGVITKSGIQHRLRKLEQIADDLLEQED